MITWRRAFAIESLPSESEKVAVAKFENLSTLTMICCPALLRTSAFMCVPGWVGLGLGEKLSNWLGNFLQAMHREQVDEMASQVFLVLNAMKYRSNVLSN